MKRGEKRTKTIMGEYTEIFVNVDLRKETPLDVLDTLRLLCGSHGEEDFDKRVARLGDHPRRWVSLFESGSYYTPNTRCANLTWDDAVEQWSLLGKGDIQNNNREIETFFEWLAPWIHAYPGAFIGYHRLETDVEPQLVYLREGGTIS